MIRTQKCLGWATVTTFLLGVICLGATLIGPSQAQAYPEPAIVPQSWELNFKYTKPRPIAVRDLSGQVKWYWYITYKVTNNTGQDQLFVPEVDIATDAGDMIKSNQNVPSAVFFAVKQQLHNSLLESPNQVVGKLLQGEDFARESVIIWPAFDHNFTEVNLFVAGLSGETATTPNPQTNKPVIVRKVLMLTYLYPGDNMTTPREQQTIKEQSKHWIMR